MKDHIELTTWEEIVAADNLSVTSKEGEVLKICSWRANSKFYIVKLPTTEPNVYEDVHICPASYDYLKHAFRFWKRREPDVWTDEAMVDVIREGAHKTYVIVPDRFADKRVKVTIEELPSGDDAGRG